MYGELYNKAAEELAQGSLPFCEDLDTLCRSEKERISDAFYQAELSDEWLEYFCHQIGQKNASARLLKPADQHSRVKGPVTVLDYHFDEKFMGRVDFGGYVPPFQYQR